MNHDKTHRAVRAAVYLAVSRDVSWAAPTALWVAVFWTTAQSVGRAVGNAVKEETG